jgi:predicted phosphodiesterase
LKGQGLSGVNITLKEDQSYRFAVLADVHGILPSLENVLADIQEESPDEVVVAGDFLGGPQSVEALTMLREAGCRLILGNGEANMLKMHWGTAPEVWWTRRQFDLARWIYRSLDDSIFQFLEILPEQLVVCPSGGEPVRIVHSTPGDMYELVFPYTEPEVLNRALRMIPEKVMVFAHNHLPDVIHRNGKLAVNPGSVSNNLNGDTRASYAMLTWDGVRWEAELRYMTYDLDQVRSVFEQTGFLEANRPLSRAFLESILTGENTGWGFIAYAFYLAEQAGHKNLEAVPDAVWLAAEETYPWHFEI